MMPGIRSFGRIGASPGFESASALRNARTTVVDLRRQQQQQQQQQQQLAFHNLQQQQPSSTQKADAVMGPSQAFANKLSQDTAVPQAYEVDSSSAHSRYTGSSSGSEHEPSSGYLEGLVSNFMDVENTWDSWRPRVGSTSSLEEEEEDSPAGLSELAASVQSLSTCSSPLESRLFSDVLCALQLARSTAALQQDLTEDSAAAMMTSPNGSSTMRRAVMARLRSAGYNAAVCKSRWDHSRGFPGGDYEYIDVVFSSSDATQRLMVDLDFRGQFQVARPTPQFEAALLATPVVFVGRTERLTQLVEMLSDACRRSLRIQGMHLPPWRKAEYLRAKWFAPYKRTTNAQVAVPGSQLVDSVNANKAVVPATVTTGALVPLSFAMWRDQDQYSAAAVLRPCQPVRRPSTAPRGVLGMLLQEQVVKTSPVA